MLYSTQSISSQLLRIGFSLDVISKIGLPIIIAIICIPFIIILSISISKNRRAAKRAQAYEKELQDIIGRLRRAKENGVEMSVEERERLINREHDIVIALQTDYEGMTDTDYTNFDYPYDY